MDEQIIDAWYLAVRAQDAWADPQAVVAEQLADLETCGRTLDGAVLGAPGIVLVLTLADLATGALLAWSESAGEPVNTVAVTDVADRLGTEVLVPDDDGRLVVDGHDLLDVAALAHRTGWSGVMLSRKKPGYFDAFAGAVGAPLHAARVGDWTLLGRDAPDDGADVDVTANLSKASPVSGRTTVLYRLGPTAGVGVVHLDDLDELHVWDAPWRPYEPASRHRLDLGEFVASVEHHLEGDLPDGALLVREHDLDDDAARDLRALLRRPTADLAAVAGVLGLPAEAVEVAEGRLRVADLPGAIVHEPLGLRASLGRALSEEPDGPGFWNAIQRASVRMPAWYLALCLAFTAWCVVVAWWCLRGDGPTWLGWVAVVLGAGELGEVVLRLRARRRRARAQAK